MFLTIWQGITISRNWLQFVADFLVLIVTASEIPPKSFIPRISFSAMQVSFFWSTQGWSRTWKRGSSVCSKQRGIWGRASSRTAHWIRWPAANNSTCSSTPFTKSHWGIKNRTITKIGRKGNSWRPPRASCMNITARPAVRWRWTGALRVWSTFAWARLVWSVFLRGVLILQNQTRVRLQICCRFAEGRRIPRAPVEW